MSYFIYSERNEGISEIAKSFEQYFNCKVEYEPKINFKTLKRKNVFYCFPAFDVAIPFKHTNKINMFIKRGFCGKITDLKALIRNGYYLCSSIFYPFLARGQIVVDTEDINSYELMLFPNNKKVKIVDFGSNTIRNILKPNYNDIWYKREIEFRTNIENEYVLPLTVINEHEYEERFVEGYTIARLSRKDKKVLSKRIKKMLIDLSNIDEKEVLYSDYVKILTEEYEKYKVKLKDRVNFDLVDELFYPLAKMLCVYSGYILTSLSHGDVQRGNIFYEKKADKLWLLDWETNGQRSIYYDSLTYQYDLKNKRLQLDVFKEVIKNNKLEVYTAKQTFLKDNDLKNAIAIYLLEDILFLLDETETLPNGIAGNLKFYQEEEIQDYLSILLK